jgi:outer membrane protein
LIDSLINFLKAYNTDRKYDYILNASNVLVGPEAFNITAEVLQEMNTRYKETQPEK